MPKFAANLTFMFNEVPFLHRFEAAARAGFTAVEFSFPYTYAEQAVSYVYTAETVKERLDAHGLTLVLGNIPVGNWAAGERGIAAFPDRIGEFQTCVTKIAPYAKLLGCKQLTCHAGIAPLTANDDDLLATFIGNLRFAAEVLGNEGIKVLIEPLNTRDVPRFYLNRTRQALDIIEAAGSENIYLQYDVYHAQVMEGDLARNMEISLPKLAHVQFSDNPGRHEPGSGEIHYPFLLKWLDSIGYTGWIGCEYRPATTTLAGLDWYKPYAQL